MLFSFGSYEVFSYSKKPIDSKISKNFGLSARFKNFCDLIYGKVDAMMNSINQASVVVENAFDPQRFAKPLGETIRQIRMARGLSLEKLAAASSLTKQAVRRIETGAVANASVATLLRISEALGVRIGVLMFLAERTMNKDPSLIGFEMEDRLADFWYRSTSELLDLNKKG